MIWTGIVSFSRRILGVAFNQFHLDPGRLVGPEHPRTAEVTVLEPGFRTPLIDMQRCSALITTIVL
jgi:hypothetical protein